MFHLWLSVDAKYFFVRQNLDLNVTFVCCLQRWWTKVSTHLFYMKGRWMCHITKCEKREFWLVSGWPRIVLFVTCRQWSTGVVFTGCWVRFHRAQIQSRRKKWRLLCVVQLPLAHALTNNMHTAYKPAVNVCEHTCHCATALNLPALALCGIKQTVIDLRYDCLFCLAVSDGWRFARIWKVCVKYGGERGEGVVLKSTSPRRNTSGPMGRPVIIPSPRLKLNAPDSAVES